MVKSSSMLILLSMRFASAARLDMTVYEKDEPIYKCESIPTFAADPLRACASVPGHAACFSLTPDTFWSCAGTKHGPDFPTSNHCVRQHDPNGHLYAGACLHEEHALYGTATNWDGAAAPSHPAPSGPSPPPPPPPPAHSDRRRRHHSHAETSRMAPGWVPAGRDGITGISGDAIGWETEPGTSFGTGLWCEAGKPAPGWSTTASCPERVGEPLQVRVLTYNLFWWNLFGVRGGNGNSAGNLIHRSHEEANFDFMGFQECSDVQHVLNTAGIAHDFVGYSPANAIGVAWNNRVWRELVKGYTDVAEDSHLQWYGVRSAVWARLQHRSTGKIALLVNHHGPLPTHQPGGICGPEATAYNILRLIGERAHKTDTVFLIGDFNAYEDATTFSELQKYLTLAHKGTAFRGVDEFYTNCAEVIETDNLGTGGSDHEALKVTFGIY